jgi:hypothetical protein
MENIYQQAIADAKALRASAMANAKAALQEAFEPKIQEIVRMKLSEELDETVEELEEKVEEMEEGYKEEGIEEGYDEMEEGVDTLDEAGLDEIIAELEALSEGDDEKLEEGEEEYKELEEAKEDDEEEEEEEEAEEEEEEGEDEEVEGDEIDDETKIIDITLGDLKQVLQSLQAQQVDMGLDADAEMGGEEATDDAEAIDAEDEESVSLDEILAALEEEGMQDSEPGYAAGQQIPEIEEAKKKHDDEEKKKIEEELEEAKATIEQLQESFNEINLLNAKLLYMNKLFKAKSLNESQKIQVVKAFDKATSVKEVKNTYEILKENMTAKGKSQIKESYGFASKPAGVSPSSNVIDSDPFVNRWQKLAGI